jgi:hypothetical protein
MTANGLLSRLVQVACLAILLTAATTAARGATWYVAQKDPKAADSNPGTEEQPWKDLYFGAQQLKPGDTLIAKAGHYYRHTGKRFEAGIHTARGGTADSPITLKAHPGDEVVVMGGPTMETPPGDFTNPAIGAGGDYVIIDGFRVYGAAALWKVKNCILRNCELWGGNDGEFNCCIRLEYAEACRLENNLVHDNDNRKPAPGTGGSPANLPLVMAYDTTDCVIEHNEFYNATGVAIFLKDNPRNLTVRGNLFWGKGGGVMTSVQDPGQNVVVCGNVFRDLTRGAIHTHCSLKGLTVSGNTFYNCAVDLRTWTSGTSDIRIFNNVFAHTEPGHLHVEVEPHGSDANKDSALTKILLHDFNCYWGPADWKVAYRTVARSLDAWRTYGTYGFDKQSLYSDPKFIDPAKGDFRLQPDSPCLRAGKDRQTLGAYATGAERAGIDPATNPWAGNRMKVQY